MMPVVSGDVDAEHKDALDDMVDDDHCPAGSRSEALAKVVDAGLTELGYSGADRTQTGLRDIIQSAYRGALWAVLLLVGLTWVGPVEARLVVLALTPIPAALWLVDRGLARIEPRATQALTAAIGGDWQ